MPETIPPVVAAFLLMSLYAGVGVAFELGFRLGRRRSGRHRDHESPQVGAIQGATLGLLALLLGFSFAGAAERFLKRQDLVVREANAIGTAWLRAELLDAEHRDALRSSLAEYASLQLELGAALAGTASDDLDDRIAAAQDSIWRAALEGVAGRPDRIRPVLDPVNEAIDLHTSRKAAITLHLPAPVLVLIVASSLLAMAVLGYGCGLGGVRILPMTAPLAVLIVSALWLTVDLDHPRGGLIQVNDEPLRALRLDADPAR